MQVLQGYGLQRKVIHYTSNFSILNIYVMKFVNTLQSLPIFLNIIRQNYLSVDFLLFFWMSFNSK